jgi:PhzF family phenazine biosynthesis protein
MKHFKFKKIDAFTSGASAGNPAAGIYLDSIDDISREEMQRVARELKGFVNEVIYLFPDNEGYFFKYYSSECEVDFCGHGTVAVMYDLIKNQSGLSDKTVINIRVKNEILQIYNKIKESDSIFISAPSPSYLSCAPDYSTIIDAMDIGDDAINHRFTVDFINAGLNTLIVPIINLDRILSIYPGQAKLKYFCLDNNIDIILVFTGEVYDNKNRYRTRVFAPKYGYLEDPATGSGNSAFGYYLLKNDLWHGELFLIEQNGDLRLPNSVQLNTIKVNDETRVIFGGSAVVKIEGMYRID